MQLFVSGALTLAYFVVSLFFLRFWRQTRDRLFLFFSGAMTLLAVNRIFFAVTLASEETHDFRYIARLVAYLLIIWAIVDKNRAPARADG